MSVRGIGCLRWAAGLAVGLAAGLAGCSSPPATRYLWDGYQAQLYEHFKGEGDDGSPARQLQALLALAERSRQGGQPLPPGFRAHLGLLRLRLGQAERAQADFHAEKAAFPESARYMDFLLGRLPAPAAAGS